MSNKDFEKIEKNLTREKKKPLKKLKKQKENYRWKN